MLIGLMWLPNKRVFIQFHPVTYMVKLNIEMSMASLITRLASRSASDEYYPNMSSSNPTNGRSGVVHSHVDNSPWAAQGNAIQMKQVSRVVAGDSDEDDISNPFEVGAAGTGIHRRTEFEITVEKDTKGYGPRAQASLDELPLTSNVGHPKRGGVETTRAVSSRSADS